MILFCEHSPMVPQFIVLLFHQYANKKKFPEVKSNIQLWELANDVGDDDDLFTSAPLFSPIFALCISIYIRTLACSYIFIRSSVHPFICVTRVYSTVI